VDVELANRAAAELLAPRDGHLVGEPIAGFLPELHRALRPEEGPQFRASMQCRGHRGNGESFLPEVWFSSYKEGTVPKLAAIIADVSEEQSVLSELGSTSLDHQERPSLSSRELGVLRLVVQGLSNKAIALRINISESTVKNTLQQLFGKTEVRTRSQLVRVALERYRDLLYSVGNSVGPSPMPGRSASGRGQLAWRRKEFAMTSLGGLGRNVLPLVLLLATGLPWQQRPCSQSAPGSSRNDRQVGKILSVRKLLRNPYFVSRYPQIHYYVLYLAVRMADHTYCGAYETPVLDEISDAFAAQGKDVEVVVKEKRLTVITPKGFKLKAHLVEARQC
jgi:DNA-binding CsgD family transcriptional regulator